MLTVTTLPHDQRALQLGEALVPANMTRCVELETLIADVLGARYLFDRSRSDNEFEPPPAFKALLDQIAGRK